MSHVVEIQQEGVYRTYCYSNPFHHPKWPEAKRIMKITSLLESSLGINPRRVAYNAKIWGKRRTGSQ